VRANSGQKLAKILRQALWVAAAAACVSCTNNFNQVGSTSALSTVGGSTGNGNLDTGNAAPILTITNVLKDNANPTSVLDIVGDGSNAMGQLCVANTSGTNNSLPTPSSSSTPTGANQGPSTCSCTYSYTSPSVGTQTVSVDTVYYESNLIECDYTQIPGDVTTVNVSVLVTTQNASSNTISFNLTGVSGSSPTSASSYTLVSRYQCKDIVSIPYAFGPALGTPNSLYDPIQSESPEINYPLDFYTMNLGGSLAAYISNNVENWNCPGNPKDPNFGTNYNLYSVGPDSGGSYLIYPPAGSAFDRSTFYLSNAAAGVFTIPVNTYTAPTIISDGTGNPIGYAAAPIPSGTNQ
jgi:hypothetical protein